MIILLYVTDMLLTDYELILHTDSSKLYAGLGNEVNSESGFLFLKKTFL